MREMRKMEKLFKISETLEDEYKCIICYSVAKNVIFKPCLHLAICTICYEKLERKKCPVCKTKIEDKIVIYVK